MWNDIRPFFHFMSFLHFGSEIFVWIIYLICEFLYFWCVDYFITHSVLENEIFTRTLHFFYFLRHFTAEFGDFILGVFFLTLFIEIQLLFTLPCLFSTVLLWLFLYWYSSFAKKNQICCVSSSCKSNKKHTKTLHAAMWVYKNVINKWSSHKNLWDAKYEDENEMSKNISKMK